MPTIGIVAGEASGDLLGSHLIRALKKRRPDLKFVGIAGPKMQAEGAVSLYPMEKLAVRGYGLDVIRKLPELMGIRRKLSNYFISNEPDVFIGIDAPDFNLGIERKLKKHGISTIHYVSPSVWAWRRSRIKKIRKSVSKILALFPFEPALYENAGVGVSYVGHPLADVLPLMPERQAARNGFKIGPDQLVIALLPGSRQSELRYHADLFVKTALAIYSTIPDVKFLVPLVTRETRTIFEDAIFTNQADPQLFTLLFGHSQLAMAAADGVIVASGTATLEAALMKCPMVITYRMSSLSWQILKRMNYLPYVGLPNVLAGKFLVPELLQNNATPEKLAETLLSIVYDKSKTDVLKQEYLNIHTLLRQNTEEKAADAVLEYIK